MERGGEMTSNLTDSQWALACETFCNDRQSSDFKGIWFIAPDQPIGEMLVCFELETDHLIWECSDMGRTLSKAIIDSNESLDELQRAKDSLIQTTRLLDFELSRRRNPCPTCGKLP